MKFTKLKLDESLFDDDFSDFDMDTDADMDIDADVDMDSEIMQPPAMGLGTGLADNIIRLINDEWEAVQGYNDFIEVLRVSKSDESTINVIKDIVAEENKHVGQLQELLKRISPNANQIAVGEKEARNQLSSMVSGIQCWNDAPTNTVNDAVVESDAYTTLSDVDDEF